MSAIPAPRLVTALLGAYWFGSHEHVPTAALVALSGEFGVRPDAVTGYGEVPAAVPAALGHVEGAGHVGLFFDPVFRPRALRAAVHWLNGVFAGNAASLAHFTGCGICDDPVWTVETANFG